MMDTIYFEGVFDEFAVGFKMSRHVSSEYMHLAVWLMSIVH